MDNIARRILIVDDNPSIHEDLKSVLRPQRAASIDAETAELENELFSDGGTAIPEQLLEVDYIIDNAYQGKEAISMVEAAEKEGRPYSLIFMDVRMPPGMDGIQTVHSIWQKYPDIEIVICTAYSDYSWDRIVKALGPTDSLLFIKKPFDTVAIRQLAFSLTTKWEKARNHKADIIRFKDEIKKRSEELINMMSGLNALKIKAETETISKSGLLASISHGIRTPLNGILGVADMLLDTELDGDQRNLTETIKHTGCSLLTIIGDILKTSKTEAGDFELDEIEFNLRTSVENVGDLISANAREKSLEVATIIHADIPETLIGDPLRLRQVLLVLATNAISFTKTGEIVISVQRDLTPAGLMLTNENPRNISLRFEVSDTGPGLPAAQKQYLISLLTDKEHLSKTGLKDSDMGLVLCRQLAERLNGEIGVESENGLGSTFWFTCRFCMTEAPDYQILPTDTSMTGAHCLIVGDNPTSRKVLSLYINQWGGKCSEASTAEGAVEQLHTALDGNPFDVVIVDFKNGDLDDYKKVAECIRRHKNLDNCTLACLTKDAKRGDATILKDYGYSAYLTKPIRHSHLYNCLLMIKGFGHNLDAVKADSIITKDLVDGISSDRYRVLVVEDNPVNIKTLVSLLNKMTIICDVVVNGKKAVEVFSKKSYDMIIMDCNMPEMDGYEATRAIREMEALATQGGSSGQKKPHIPILALTAEAYAENRDRCLASGMDDIITKPVHFEKIKAMLKKYL